MARRNTKTSPGFNIFIGIVMILAALILFVTGSNTKKMHKRCTQSTNGIVQSVRQERRTRKSGKRRTTYYVYVTGYEFEVDNQPIHGSSTLQSGQRLSEGASLLVYYNPSKPNIEHYTRYDDSGTGSVVCSIFIGLMGVLFFVSGVKTKAARKNIVGVREMAAGTVLSGMNGNYNYNNYNNNYNTYSNDYNNSFGNSNGYNDNNFNNGYSNNYNNNYNSNYNNNYNNGYNNGYNNNNAYSDGSNNYNDFNQLN